MNRSGLISVAQLEEVVADDLCIGCGLCRVGIDKEQLVNSGVTISFDNNASSFLPDLHNADKTLQVFCPGKAMPLRSLYESKFSSAPDYLGYCLNTYAGWQTDEGDRLQAASGGISSAIVTYLLNNNLVDKAYVAVNRGVKAGSYGSYLDKKSLNNSLNDSIYHPVDFGRDILDLIRDKSRFVFVGLPCEIATLEKLKELDESLRQRCVLTIGLFCGGINRLEGVTWYINKLKPNLNPDTIKSIKYREGFWPGSIKVETNNSASFSVPRIKGNSRWNILKYIAAFQGFWMLKRCRICPDQVSYLADISVGDPHLMKYKSVSSLGVSAIVSRTMVGDGIIKKLTDEKIIFTEPLSSAEIIKSQGYTLKNRAHADKYISVARSLGMAAPTIDTLNFKKIDTLHEKKISTYAWLDLLKIKYRKNIFFRKLIVSIQLFEYFFIRFTPREFFRKLKSVASNKS